MYFLAVQQCTVQVYIEWGLQDTHNVLTIFPYPLLHTYVDSDLLVALAHLLKLAELCLMFSAGEAANGMHSSQAPFMHGRTKGTKSASVWSKPHVLDVDAHTSHKAIHVTSWVL